jgi:bifunctional DNase/RNase
MALALRAKAPIFCAEAVLELAAISDEEDGVVH